jgi:ERCC4-type nuclease
MTLERLAVRAAKFAAADRPRYAQQPRAAPALAAEAMLAAVPGISMTSARALLAQFGSVAGVIMAGEKALHEVPGMGPKRAKALTEVLGKTGPN